MTDGRTDLAVCTSMTSDELIIHVITGISSDQNLVVSRHLSIGQISGIGADTAIHNAGGLGGERRDSRPVTCH